MTWTVEIRRHNDDGVEKVFGPYDHEAWAERIDDGLNINLNHEVFYTVIVPARPTAPDGRVME